MVIAAVLAVLVVVCALHMYLWLRLVRNTTHPASRSRKIGTAASIAMATLVVGTMIGSQVLPRSQQGVLAWPGFIWLALAFYLLVTLLLLEIPALIARLILRRRTTGEAQERPDTELAGQPKQAGQAGQAGQELAGQPKQAGKELAGQADPGRRMFIARTVALTAGIASAGAVGTGIISALGPPNRDRISVPLAKLPSRLDRFRIALVSDIHLGPILGRSHTRRIVDIINACDADVIAVVGDVVDGDVNDLRAAVEPLRDLRSRHGAYFVTGNHEYYSGADAWVEHFSSLGLRPLRNEMVMLDGLAIAGVEDFNGSSHGAPVGQASAGGIAGPDYDRALAGRDPNVPVVLLAHQPIQAHEAAKRGVDLQLSGHTHDGQMWPFSLAVGLVQPLRAGLGTIDGMPVFVTRGAGFWGPPVRFGAPPDITLIELRSV